MITVLPGQLIRLHIAKASDDLHPMHLHGHAFTVLARNGQPLTGSPIILDTLAVALALDSNTISTSLLNDR